MKGVTCYVVIGIVFGILLTGEIHAQKPHKPSKSQPTTPAPQKTLLEIPFLNQPTTTSKLNKIDRLVQQNSSLPFSARFPKPDRHSTKFHYPALPSVYFTTYKKPEVPLVDPDQDLALGFDL